MELPASIQKAVAQSPASLQTQSTGKMSKIKANGDGRVCLLVNEDQAQARLSRKGNSSDRAEIEFM